MPRLIAQAISFISFLIEGQPLSMELVEVISNLLHVPTQIFITRKTVEKYLVGSLGSTT